MLRQKPSALILDIIVPYRTPSLNLTKRSHWTKQYKEKLKAWDALESGFVSAVSAYSTQTPQPPQLKICSMALEELRLYRMTLGITSSSNSNKKKLTTSIKKTPKSE